MAVHFERMDRDKVLALAGIKNDRYKRRYSEYVMAFDAALRRTGSPFGQSRRKCGKCGCKVRGPEHDEGGQHAHGVKVTRRDGRSRV